MRQVELPDPARSGRFRFGPWALAVALFAPPGLELAAGRAPWSGGGAPATAQAWCDGAPFRRWERAADPVATRDALLPYYREALFGAFDVAPQAVVPGRDGWLFFRDHVVGYPGPEGPFLAESAGRLAAALSDYCADRGAVLVAAPAPNKETLVRDRFAASTPPPGELYGAILGAWRRRGVRVVDLRPPLVADLAAAWHRTDTHWTFAGARAAAAAVSEALRAERDRGDFGPRAATEFRAAPPAPYRGDLFALLGFRADGPFGERFTETTAAVVGFAADGAPAADRAVRPLVVAGSSASARFGFAAALGAELGVRVEDRSADASGLFGTLFALLREVDAGLRPMPRAIVWEFVERAVRYEAEANRAELTAWLRERGASPAYARQGASPLAVADPGVYPLPPDFVADGRAAFSLVVAAPEAVAVVAVGEDAAGSVVWGPVEFSVDPTPRRRLLPLGSRAGDPPRADASHALDATGAGDGPRLARIRLVVGGPATASRDAAAALVVSEAELRPYRP